MLVDPGAPRVRRQRKISVADGDDAGVGADRLARRDQLFHQRVAEQPELGVAAERVPALAKRLLPAVAAQGRHQRATGRRIAHHQQSRILVENGGGVARRAARLANPGERDLRRLQGVQLLLDARERQPHQRIEKIVQVRARRHAAGGADEFLVGAPFRQFGLWHEAQRLTAGVGQPELTGAHIEGGDPVAVVNINVNVNFQACERRPHRVVPRAAPIDLGQHARFTAASS